ncbi:hypothetical protein [Acinetobacter seifertii]|jgi:hypothetical protein|nr:hypothetical protein [Acinetobacter seifertii]
MEIKLTDEKEEVQILDAILSSIKDEDIVTAYAGPIDYDSSM